MSEEKHVTKKELKEELNSFGQGLRAEMQSSNQGLRAEMQASNKALRAEITAIFTEKVGQVEEKFFKYSIIAVGLILGGVSLIQYMFSNGQKQPIVIYTYPPASLLKDAPDVADHNTIVYPQPQVMQGSQQKDTRQPQQAQ